jgi:intracellular septation protein
MKILLDFLPLVFFFATYKVAGMNADAAAAFATHWFGGLVSGGVVGPKEAPVLLATIVVIVATLLQVAYMKLNKRRIDLMLWISLAMIVVLGGATVWFHNETVVKWKPSVVYWAMGLIFWTSQTFFHRNLLRQTLGEEIELPDFAWQRLNFAWVAFFGLLGLLNLWVASSFSTDTWANFHTFGSLGIMLAFMLGVGVYMARHMPPEVAQEATAAPAAEDADGAAR